MATPEIISNLELIPLVAKSTTVVRQDGTVIVIKPLPESRRIYPLGPSPLVPKK